MKRAVMGLAAGCLLASGVWGAAFPFECVGGAASVSVPADAAIGADGSVMLSDTPLSVSVEDSGVTAVTVTFEAELPAGTSDATLAEGALSFTGGRSAWRGIAR